MLLGIHEAEAEGRIQLELVNVLKPKHENLQQTCGLCG
jgi:hypothetical protein